MILVKSTLNKMSKMTYLYFSDNQEVETKSQKVA